MQITTPAPHHSVFHRPDALPAAQPTASKHWRWCHHTGRLFWLTAVLCIASSSVVCLSVCLSVCQAVKKSARGRQLPTTAQLATSRDARWRHRRGDVTAARVKSPSVDCVCVCECDRNFISSTFSSTQLCRSVLVPNGSLSWLVFVVWSVDSACPFSRPARRHIPTLIHRLFLPTIPLPLTSIVWISLSFAQTKLLVSVGSWRLRSQMKDKLTNTTPPNICSTLPDLTFPLKLCV